MLLRAIYLPWQGIVTSRVSIDLWIPEESRNQRELYDGNKSGTKPFPQRFDSSLTMNVLLQALLALSGKCHQTSITPRSPVG
jgi:hypothetical protein